MADPTPGSVSTALAGIKTPSQGSLVGDIADAGGAFLQGLREEQQRQDEMRLAEMALALQATGLSIQDQQRRDVKDFNEENLRLQTRTLDIGEREGIESAATQARIAGAQEDQARAQLENVEARRQTIEQAQTAVERRGAGAKSTISTMFEGKFTQQQVDSMSAEQAIEVRDDLLEQNKALLQARGMSAGQITGELGRNVTTANASTAALRGVEAELQDRRTALLAPLINAPGLKNRQGVEMFFPLIQRTDPQFAEEIQADFLSKTDEGRALQAEFEAIAEERTKRQATSDLAQSSFDENLRSLQQAGLLGGDPVVNAGQRTPITWDLASDAQKQETIASVVAGAQNNPSGLVRRIPALIEKGVDVNAILLNSPLKITMDQLIAEVGGPGLSEPPPALLTPSEEINLDIDPRTSEPVDSPGLVPRPATTPVEELTTSEDRRKAVTGATIGPLSPRGIGTKPFDESTMSPEALQFVLRKINLAQVNGGARALRLGQELLRRGVSLETVLEKTKDAGVNQFLKERLANRIAG